MLDSDFDQTIASNNEPILVAPTLNLAHLGHDDLKLSAAAKSVVAQGMELGCLWVDTGNKALEDSCKIWSHVEETLDTARDAPHWKGSRFEAPRDKYLDALMNSAFGSGTHYFARPSFETSTTVQQDCSVKSPECFADIGPLLWEILEVMTSSADHVFRHMGAEHLGIEPDFLADGPEHRLAALTLHRVTPSSATEQQKTTAQQHFDFNIANVLLYNYCEGFKVYNDKVWFQLAEPDKPSLLLFNFGSVLSICSNRQVTALFHPVDSPLGRSRGMAPRLSLICPMVPKLSHTVYALPKLLKKGEPSLFDLHTYREHVFYASKCYTSLSKHVVFDDKSSASSVTFSLGTSAMAVAKTKLGVFKSRALAMLSRE